MPVRALRNVVQGRVESVAGDIECHVGNTLQWFHVRAAGLPLGVQLVGHFGGDSALLGRFAISQQQHILAAPRLAHRCQLCDCLVQAQINACIATREIV